MYQVTLNDQVSTANHDVAVTRDGTVWVSDGHSALVRIDKSGAQSLVQLGNGVLQESSQSNGPDGSAAAGKLYAEPDDSVWVSEVGALAHVSAGGQVLDKISLPSGVADTPEAFATGADGALWFTAGDKGVIERLDPSTNQVTEYPDGIGSGYWAPNGLALGSDGRLWYTLPGTYEPEEKGSVGAISTNGTASVYNANPRPYVPGSITAANGSLWYFGYGNRPLTRLTPGAGGAAPKISATWPARGFPVVPEDLGQSVASPAGSLWLPGNGGITSVSSKGSAAAYGRANGVPTKQTSEDAAAIAPDRTVWMLGTLGESTTLEHLIPTAPLPCVVPNVTGQDVTPADASLKRARCKETHGKISGPRDTPAIVTKQTPAPNAVTDTSQPVQLTIKRGVPYVASHCAVVGANQPEDNSYTVLRVTCKAAQTITRKVFAAAIKNHTARYHSFTCTGTTKNLNVSDADGESSVVTCRGSDAKHRPRYLKITENSYWR
ncbi:MAG: hypothetical protein J2O48_00950 [Solirubrobacterales bacterium]|nr:hypothetical protein [Solirubrobacterales bacterium]